MPSLPASPGSAAHFSHNDAGITTSYRWFIQRIVAEKCDAMRRDIRPHSPHALIPRTSVPPCSQVRSGIDSSETADYTALKAGTSRRCPTANSCGDARFRGEGLGPPDGARGVTMVNANLGLSG